MAHDPRPDLLRQVDPERLRADLYHLAKDPLPFRKLNYRLPGHVKSTLEEADDFLQARLESWGYSVEKEGCPVQAFRRDRTKKPSAQFSRPDPGDPWYTAYNVYARRTGSARPDEIVLVVAHKDSQSWIDSPGAYDNGVGTVATLEIARVLRDHSPARTICFLFCNEEHTPWTSVTAARRARERGDRIVALFNIDSVGGKGPADIAAGRRTNVTQYASPEGKELADLMAEVNETYGIGLTQIASYTERPGDDHGSFFKEGYAGAVANFGSLPYLDPNYHLESDVPESVDLENVAMSTRASLAAIVRAAG